MSSCCLFTASFIRFIYNRIILENATIRASAVAALAKFGAQVPVLRKSIITLLGRCQDDDDDEVRDRATLHLQTLIALGTDVAPAGSDDHSAWM